MNRDARSIFQNLDSSWSSSPQGQYPNVSGATVMRLLESFEKTCSKLLETMNNHSSRLMNI